MRLHANRSCASLRSSLASERLFTVAIAIASLGCNPERAAVPVEILRYVAPEMVTGAAASALDAGGYFRLPFPTLRPNQVQLEEATEQTLQFAKYATNNVLLRGAIEEGRGGYWTDPHLLTPCSRDAYYVRSQLGAISVDTLPPNGRALLLRQFGAQWLVPLCGAMGEPQMTVQIAVDGNDIRFQSNVPIEPYYSLSTAYFGRGVPLGWPDALPISAERAVRFAYDQVKVPIAEVPELFYRGGVEADGEYRGFQIGSARYCNRWRIVFDREVALRGDLTQTERLTREVFVGSTSCRGTDVIPLFQLPLAEQPAFANLEYHDYTGATLRSYYVAVPIASPVRFEEARPPND
jgi:hypothetical protein